MNFPYKHELKKIFKHFIINIGMFYDSAHFVYISTNKTHLFDMSSDKKVHLLKNE